MKSWAISDTHGMHRLAIIPDNIECLLYGGDSTNHYYLPENLKEFEDFFDWIVNLNIKHKVLIAGNHDAWATKAYNRDRLKEAGIIYLDNEYVEIENKLIFGSPWTPTFGNWYFMRDRSKMDNIWKELQENIDVLLTHGPPQGILDLTEDSTFKQCGDSALYKRVIEKRPRFHIFGHIHNFKSCRNQGLYQHNNYPITFMNVSAVEDGQFKKGLTSNGIVIDI